MKTTTLRLLFSACAFLLGILSPAHALTIPASEDTTGYLNKLTSMASSSASLQVDSSRVAFLYFNLDDIPEGSVVKTARLRFYLPSIKSKGAGLGVHRVKSQWNEAIPGAQPVYEAAPVAEIEASKLGSRRFISVDVTSLVQDWVNFTEENEGFAITALSTGSARISPASVVISAKEGPALGLPALLDIELENVGGSDTLIPLERLPASVQALAGGGTLKLQSNAQLPDDLRTFLSPQIIQQPSIPAEGGNLSAQAEGFGKLSYQWMRNGVPITGQTSSELSVQGLSSGTYALLVSNGFASVTSGSFKFSAPAPAPAGFVLVTGGALPSNSALGAVPVNTFYIGKTEVTWGEWKTVLTWALSNGYADLKDVGAGVSDNHPVTDVNWYDVAKWCNARSQKEGKTPVYKNGADVYRTGEVTPTEIYSADGYRLPSEKEWEFAARGGKQTSGYTYSGSNTLDEVGWFSGNSNGRVQEIGKKRANELGIYDMTGNLGEWTGSWWPSFEGSARVFRGGYWGTSAPYCAISLDRSYYGYLRYRGSNLGFRVALDSVP